MVDEEKTAEEVKESAEEPVNFIEDAPQVSPAPQESAVPPEESADDFEKGVGSNDAPADPSMVLDLEGTSDEFPAFEPVPLIWYK